MKLPKFKSFLLLFLSLCSPLLLQGCNNGQQDKSQEELNRLSEAEPATETAAPTAARSARQLAESYLSKTPASPAGANLTLEQGKQIQKQFVRELSKTLGPRVGYKAGLTNAAARERFQVAEPLRGVLLEKMLLPNGANGAVVPANFGIRAIAEGDLIVRVGRDAINQAETPQEVLASLDAAIPFIELADLVYSEKVKLDASAIAAINVGARSGILGNPIPLAATEEWEKRLANLQLELLDESGTVLAAGKGSDLLGHPLNVVLWLKDSLAAEGKQLKKGDLLSLGTIAKPIPVRANTKKIRARYIGLDPAGSVEIEVNFE
ncbi:MAG: hydratase [Oscillatoria sp. SIO1A7]|nr:hydratase [Oscillatoria sp. SIO1A7]